MEKKHSFDLCGMMSIDQDISSEKKEGGKKCLNEWRRKDSWHFCPCTFRVYISFGHSFCVMLAFNKNGGWEAFSIEVQQRITFWLVSKSHKYKCLILTEEAQIMKV